MILSNTHILAAVDAGEIMIDPLAGRDVSRAPFNTSAVDLRLADTLSIPTGGPATIQLDRPYDKDYAARNSEQRKLTKDQPFNLEPNKFVLGQIRPTG